jgi:hypothetical protein
MTFVRNIQQFVRDEGIDSGCFRQGQHKDDVTQRF